MVSNVAGISRYSFGSRLYRPGAPQEFDFMTFLVHSIQEDYAKIIGTNHWMWAMAALYVMVPRFVFLPASILTLLVMLVVGAVQGTLHSVEPPFEIWCSLPKYTCVKIGHRAKYVFQK